MSDISKNTNYKNREETPVFNSKEEDNLISESIKQSDKKEDSSNNSVNVKNEEDEKKLKKSKDITSKTQPEIEINGTSSTPWGWIVGGFLALLLIGAIIYIYQEIPKVQKLFPQTLHKLQKQNKLMWKMKEMR